MYLEEKLVSLLYKIVQSKLTHLCALQQMWVHVNNHVMSHECWLKGAKNLYLAFYEQTSSCGAKQGKFKSKIPCIISSATSNASSKRKLPQTYNSDKGPRAKRPNVVSTSSSFEDWGGVTLVERPVVLQTEWRDYRYFPIDEAWQSSITMVGVHITSGQKLRSTFCLLCFTK